MRIFTIPLFSLWLFPAGLVWSAEPESSGNAANEAAVAEVAASARTEANAAWWGFDPDDATAAVQAAIDSGAARVRIPYMGRPWIVTPITLRGGLELIFEPGVVLLAKEGLFQGKSDSLFTAANAADIVVRGYGATLRMRKADYQSEAYEKAEWRMCLAFRGCRNLHIEGLRLESSGGDGIYLGATQELPWCEDVVIRDVICHDHHRQGISVISAQDLLIEDCRLRHTEGTAPQAGIDFEPNHPADSLVRCVMRRCTAESNAGTGFQICPQSLDDTSSPISIHLDQCTSRSNGQHAIHLCSAPKSPPVGHLRITRFFAEKDAMAGLSVQFNPYNAVRIEIEDSVLRDCALTDRFFPPLYVQGLEADSRPAGNLHFRNVTVKDDRDRPILRIRDRHGNGVKAITGDIILERNGQRTPIAIDDAWLDTMRE